MTSTAEDLIPPSPTLESVRQAAMGCRACPLWRDATRTVFGEGPADARVMLVGEVPGDQEDKQGHPFVGPAGRLLDRCLEEVGLDRSQVWLTNAVKHFKYKKLGTKRRIHDKPRASEISACKPWVLTEIELVQPDVLVCLGATAAKALIGPKHRVSLERGQLVDSPLARFVMSTVHPSSLLRRRDDPAYYEERERFVDDLRRIVHLLQEET